MMAWLGEWLGQVLAVLLLAAVVDLLVPGKAYERYTRLALGLIILTAMLGPLLKLFREDPERLLGRGFAGLEAQADRSTPRMPGRRSAVQLLGFRPGGSFPGQPGEAVDDDAVDRADRPG